MTAYKKCFILSLNQKAEKLFNRYFYDLLIHMAFSSLQDEILLCSGSW